MPLFVGNVRSPPKLLVPVPLTVRLPATVALELSSVRPVVVPFDLKVNVPAPARVVSVPLL